MINYKIILFIIVVLAKKIISELQLPNYKYLFVQNVYFLLNNQVMYIFFITL